MMNTTKAQRVQKKKFTISEDALLRTLVKKYGDNDWERIAELMGGRNVRQCKDRWEYYLSPNVNNSPWTEEEEAKLVRLVNEIGFRWVKISKFFQGRTDTQIKNKWNVLKRRMDADVPIQIPLAVLESQPAPVLYQTAILQQGVQNTSINHAMQEYECDSQTCSKNQEQPTKFLNEEQLNDSSSGSQNECISEASCISALFARDLYTDAEISLADNDPFFLHYNDSRFDFFA